jgi:hypothetical protein
MNERVGSQTFDTAIMKTDEVFIFIKACTDSGATLNEAYEDMKMIDNMLHMKRLHLAMYGHINKTRSGNLRKGSGIYNAIDGILNSRLKLNQTT